MLLCVHLADQKQCSAYQIDAQKEPTRNSNLKCKIMANSTDYYKSQNQESNGGRVLDQGQYVHDWNTRYPLHPHAIWKPQSYGDRADLYNNSDNQRIPAVKSSPIWPCYFLRQSICPDPKDGKKAHNRGESSYDQED